MATYRQDAAPAGGYKDIEWTRLYGKRPSGLKIFAGFIALKVVGLTWFFYFRKKERLERIEDADSRIALFPFFIAENDRLKMKNYRYLRDEEALVMKDIPGWEVGKCNGEEMYNNEQNRFAEELRVETKALRRRSIIQNILLKY